MSHCQSFLGIVVDLAEICRTSTCRGEEKSQRSCQLEGLQSALEKRREAELLAIGAFGVPENWWTFPSWFPSCTASCTFPRVWPILRRQTCPVGTSHFGSAASRNSSWWRNGGKKAWIQVRMCDVGIRHNNACIQLRAANSTVVAAFWIYSSRNSALFIWDDLGRAWVNWSSGPELFKAESQDSNDCWYLKVQQSNRWTQPGDLLPDPFEILAKSRAQPRQMQESKLEIWEDQ